GIGSKPGFRVHTTESHLRSPTNPYKKLLIFGVEKFKSALIGQFRDLVPPLRVFQALTNQLWNYDGFVAASELSPVFNEPPVSWTKPEPPLTRSQTKAFKERLNTYMKAWSKEGHEEDADRLAKGGYTLLEVKDTSPKLEL
ncbi:hypothetical protein LINPERHAP1_LOCUS1617, partial [Linum perenne]